MNNFLLWWSYILKKGIHWQERKPEMENSSAYCGAWNCHKSVPPYSSGWVSGLVPLSIASWPRTEGYKERNVIDQGHHGCPQRFTKEPLCAHCGVSEGNKFLLINTIFNIYISETMLLPKFIKQWSLYNYLVSLFCGLSKCI